MFTAKDAANHIGEKVTICGEVFRESNKAFSVGLYLGDDSPGAYVVVSIRFKIRFRHAVGADYFHFEGKKICVTGIVRKGPLIKVNDLAQIKIDTGDQAEKNK